MKHLKKKTKTNIVKACADLAEGYKLDTLKHLTDKCPLCLIYHDQDNSICDSNCPNNAFKADGYYGCIDRCDKFGNLSWRRYDNDVSGKNNLEIFWTKVGAYLSKKSEADIIGMTVQVKERIQEIARDVNKL